MTIIRVRCPIAGVPVTRVVDFEGDASRVICPEFEDATGICRLKRHAREGGPLSQLLARVSDDTLAVRSVRCDLR